MNYLNNDTLQNLVGSQLLEIILKILLPFLLIFTIIYAVLIKSEILGKKKNFSIAVAFVIALLVVVQGSVVEIINSAIPNVSIVVVAIVMFLIVVGVMGGKVKWIGSSLSGWIALISAAIVLYIFGNSAGWWGKGYYSNPWLNWMNDPTTVSTVILILVFGVIVWFITRDDDTKEKGPKVMEDLGKLFKGD